jgi:hypothetical protein
MQHIPATPLGQALAAIIQILIAAIAEHAREHPMLAGGCRASIRQLEKIARRFDAMVLEWQADSRMPRPPPRPKPATRTATRRRRKRVFLRRCVVMWTRVPSARAPPRSCPAHRPRSPPRHA